MRARSRSIWTTVAASFASLLCFAASASAQGQGGVTFTSFGSDIEVRSDGSFDVAEEITGSFEEPRHGLFRFIPVAYERPDGSTHRIRLRVDSVRRDGERAPFESYRSGAYQVIKIGEPDATFAGDFRYDLAYHVENALLFRDLEDELYWNVTGDAWDAPLPSVRATVKVAGAAAGDLRNECFPSSGSSCELTLVKDGIRMSATGPMTVSVRFPKNLAHEPGTQARLAWWLSDNWDLFFPIVPLFAFLVLFHRWRHHGEDPKGKRPIVAEYEPPAGLRPAELGTLVSARVQRAFAATVVDLAVRGFLTIEQKDKDYALTLKRPDGDLKPHERAFLDLLFEGRTEVGLSGSDAATAKARRALEDALYRHMADDGYYVKNPRTERFAHAVIGILVLAVGILLGAQAAAITGRPIAMISLITTGGFFLLFAPFMPKKTEKGAIVADRGLGLKEYLSVAEKYRSRWQEEQGIFEKLLPYAIVFGVADKWASALAEKQTASPAWYAGPAGSAWDASSFGNSMDSFISSLNAASAPASSGGSGGGGSSGGGFGGGGGGSW
ncbi:DUF2207 domain-containing protein [Patescibacteria group bacterium]|nr:MAG: DUF2207 domain-containing protein [Patescibacteria group bacterium]